MYKSYVDMSITVTHHGQHVSGSPYFLGAVLHEDCACPMTTSQEWLSNFQCPESEEQINVDLEPFRREGVNVTGLYQRIEEMYSRSSVVHYSIVDGKVDISSLSR